MPVGYLITVPILGACVLLLLLPVSGWRPLAMLSFWGGLLVNEQPHWFALLLTASTGLAFAEGDIDSTAGWVTFGLSIPVTVGLLVLLARAFPSRAALREAIGGFEDLAVRRLSGRRSYAAALLAPVAFGFSRARRTGNISYGPAGKANRLDVYRPRKGEVTGPTLIYLHGGRFRRGGKRREAQAIHYRLAGRGWLVVSANYRLNPEGRFPDYLIDLKRVIAWVRSEGLAFGVDPERVYLAGGSAGAHISAMAGLTADRPELQPGFEQVDTSVSGVIGLYGYYGSLDVAGDGKARTIPSSPRDHVHGEAPPFLLIHGSHDSVMSADGARALAGDLKAAGNEAGLAELPGAEHTFDLLRSVRVENTIDSIEDFAAWASHR